MSVAKLQNLYVKFIGTREIRPSDTARMDGAIGEFLDRREANIIRDIQGDVNRGYLKADADTQKWFGKALAREGRDEHDSNVRQFGALAVTSIAGLACTAAFGVLWPVLVGVGVGIATTLLIKPKD